MRARQGWTIHCLLSLLLTHLLRLVHHVLRRSVVQARQSACYGRVAVMIVFLNTFAPLGVLRGGMVTLVLVACIAGALGVGSIDVAWASVLTLYAAMSVSLAYMVESCVRVALLAEIVLLQERSALQVCASVAHVR